MKIKKTKYILLTVLLLTGCSGPREGSIEVSNITCDENNVLWSIYQDGHKEPHVDDMGRYERCKD